jgi:1-acyl-sn-glycerol-3-phosphate acyltransferase
MILLRSLLFAGWFYGLTTIMALGTVPLRLFAPLRALGYAKLWARLILGGLRLICGIRFSVTGLEHLPPTGPALIASMHQSAFDTLVWEQLAPRFVFVLKKELTRIPLFGPTLLTAGMIAVDRDGGAAAVRTLLRDADRAVAQDRQIVIFPEGTRVAPGAGAPLQPGIAALAARTRLPVIPVVTDSGRYWGRHAFRKYPGQIRIALLPPIEAGLPREALMQRLQTAFAEGSESIANRVDKSVGSDAKSLPLRVS